MNRVDVPERAPGDAIAIVERAIRATGGAGTLWLDTFSTELGPMVAVATDSQLALLEFADREDLCEQATRLRDVEAGTVRLEQNRLLRDVAARLHRWFRGEAVGAPPLLISGTPFQEAVWREILQIPRGGTTTYGELARRAGYPDAMRAAGVATGANRIALFIPCHRVVPQSGGVGGCAGGAARKRRLLDLERAPGVENETGSLFAVAD